MVQCNWHHGNCGSGVPGVDVGAARRYKRPSACDRRDPAHSHPEPGPITLPLTGTRPISLHRSICQTWASALRTVITTGPGPGIRMRDQAPSSGNLRGRPWETRRGQGSRRCPRLGTKWRRERSPAEIHPLREIAE
ncbi:hypothetical protein SKAU_G00301880 [Synaphobranchus kaupii]|uniref:Uncharacterized protein n=1 Tax=Synaphobranchus kaupii TaxID=118154 RepID=A0A9Q1EVW3_SYNKA|nr:hypothetical protein SKAU_G00301880 [Synaphobranchus kaupii]